MTHQKSGLGELAMGCSVYVARRMTGMNTDVLLSDAKHVRSIMAQYGVKAIDPVLEEEVKPGIKELQAGYSDLKQFWARDKQIIKYEADVFVDRNPDMWSAGREREAGIARCLVWMPVVRIWPGYKMSVAEFEDDAIVSSIDEAGALIREKWGTKWKRFVWRIKMLNRCLPGFIWLQLYRLVK